MTKDNQKTNTDSNRVRIIKNTTSPLKFFALAILVCNAVFGLGTAIFAKGFFIYTLHTFLGVIFAFVMIGLWSPRSFYAPEQLIGLAEAEAKLPEGKTILPASRPLIPSLLMVVLAIGYAIYQANI